MSVLRRATESQSGDTEWLPLTEGLWRFEIGQPEFKYDSRGKLRVHFPLVLTPDEQTRLKEQEGEPPEGQMQSWRASYRPGLSLGFFQSGVYQPTMLIDFLCASLGVENGKRFRKWIEEGGGPRRPEDRDDQQAELDLILAWLQWWQGLEVFGTITHSEPDKQGRIWANFAGPMPVGSLPGQPEPDYQALCRGKFRAMREEAGEDPPKPVKLAGRQPVAAQARMPQATDDEDEAF